MAMLLAIGIMAMVGPGVIGVIEAITIVYLPIFARISRAPAIEQMTREYIEAEHSLGASTIRILFRHVLANIWPVIIIQLSLITHGLFRFNLLVSTSISVAL